MNFLLSYKKKTETERRRDGKSFYFCFYDELRRLFQATEKSMVCRYFDFTFFLASVLTLDLNDELKDGR